MDRLRTTVDEMERLGAQARSLMTEIEQDGETVSPAVRERTRDALRQFELDAGTVVPRIRRLHLRIDEDLDAAGKDKLAGGHKKACLELKELSKSFNWQAYKSRRMSEQEKTVANLVKDWFSWVK